MKPPVWDGHYAVALASLEKLRATLFDQTVPGRANAYLLSARRLIEAAAEELTDAGEPPQEPTEIHDLATAAGQRPRSEPVGEPARTGPFAEGPPAQQAPAPPADQPTFAAPPAPELMKQLEARCQEVFRVKQPTGGTVFSTGCMREWLRCEFPGYVAGVPLPKQLTTDDVEELLEILSDPVQAKNDKLQNARFDYRAVRAQVELLGLTTYGLSAGQTVEVIKRWTKGAKEAIEQRRLPDERP